MLKRDARISIFSSLLVFAFFVGTWGYSDVPGTVTIHGQLLDEAGVPLTGNRDYEIVFYDTEIFGSVLGAPVSGTTELSREGIFDISLVLPEEAKSIAELWYAIAVDSDVTPNGLDGSDVFPNRIRVESVPFALQAGSVESIPLLEGVATPVQEQLDAKANAADVYTQIQVDNSQALQDAAIAEKASLTDVYTKIEVDDLQAIQDVVIAGNLARDGESYVIVETTDNAITNGTNLLAAYTLAKTKTPHGMALSTLNRVAVVIPPGLYDLGTGALTLDTEFVDLVGFSTARDNQHIVGATAGVGTGVIVQTADDVHIENLLIECTLPD